MFRNKRVGANSKRKITMDEEEPRRRSSAGAIVPAPKPLNVAPRLTAMGRKDHIPTSDLEYAMLGDSNVFIDFHFATSAKMTSIAYSKSDVGIGTFLPIAVSLGTMFTALGGGTTVPAEELRLGTSSSTTIFLLELAETRLFLNNAFFSSSTVTVIGSGTGTATLEINSAFPSRTKPIIS